MKKKTKCYIYTRVSTAIQVDGYSLDAQKDKLRKYAEFQDMEIVGEYSDEGHSGKNIKGRQEFMRMLNDIEDGKDGVDFVLVFKLSRFGRNAADVLSSLQLMQIAYGRRRTEKRAGTRNETHVVEQSDFPVYEGIHDPEHAHILSGILKCPCCGKGMYGNIAKAGRKDNKTRYYYYCKNTVNATGHKCTFRRNIEQSQIDDMQLQNCLQQ